MGSFALNVHRGVFATLNSILIIGMRLFVDNSQKAGRAMSAEVAGEIPADEGVASLSRVTRFNFESKVFQADGAFFALSDGEAFLHVPLGEVTARAPIQAVCREFNVAPASPDYRLLWAVQKALAYVPTIRHGDALPSELVDGTASWRFGPEHEALALGRALWCVHVWSTGGDPVAPTRADLVGFEERAPWIASRDDALQRLGEAMGMSAGAEEARKRLGEVAREFAFIEALREHFVGIAGFALKLGEARRAVVTDRVRREEYDCMVALARTPLNLARIEFAKLDALLADAPAAVRDPRRTIAKIRDGRDRLHIDTMKWRDVLALWDETARVSEETRRRETYRFLATHFAEGSEWSRMSAAG